MSESVSTPDPSLLSINTATVRQQWRLPDIVSGCAALGIRGIAPWRDQVAETGLKEAAQRIRDAGLFVSGYCRGGMFPAIDGAGRRAARDDNRRAVDEALTVAARCLVLVVGGLPKDGEGRIASKDLAGARSMVRDGVGDLLEYSRSAGMPLAIEPLHPMYAADRACINTMAQANDLCDELGDDGLGIAVDVYHVWWDRELKDQIERAGDKRLLAFHFCDWLGPTRAPAIVARTKWKFFRRTIGGSATRSRSCAPASTAIRRSASASDRRKSDEGRTAATRFRPATLLRAAFRRPPCTRTQPRTKAGATMSRSPAIAAANADRRPPTCVHARP